MKALSFPVALTAFALFTFFGCKDDTSPPSLAATPATIPAAPTTPSPSSRWSISKSINDLDGKPKITVSDGDLVVRCAPKFEGYLMPTLNNLGGQLHTDEEDHGQRVRYRLDQGPLKTEYWSGSTDFSALFPSKNTLRMITQSKKLVYEYTPEYQTATTTTIDLDGLKDAMNQAGCKI
jgi:hypothetical protein